MIQMSQAIVRMGNEHLKKIGPNEILAFDARVSALPDMVKLTLGEPDFSVDITLQEAAIHSIRNNESHYMPPSGAPALRKAIAQFLQDRYGLSYDFETEIMVTVGGTEGIFSSLMALVNPGEKVLIPTPAFPLYEADSLLLGAVPVAINTAADNFILTPERLSQAIKDHPQARVLVLNYPCNPTGVTYSRAQLQELADVLRDKEMVVIADEIYSELVYEEKHSSIAEFLPGQTILLNGLSKSHAMTGYRVGYMAAPQQLARKLFLPHTFAVTCLPAPMMAAAQAALTTDAGKEAVNRMRNAYAERKRLLVDRLERMGFEVCRVQGAFYVFAKIPPQCSQDDIVFAEELADQARVAVIAGSYFGPGGEGYVRMSYATSIETLTVAADRIESYLSQK